MIGRPSTHVALRNTLYMTKPPYCVVQEGFDAISWDDSYRHARFDVVHPIS